MSQLVDFVVPALGVSQVEIEDAIHDLVAGVTGIAGSLVRPRWQPEPPREPEKGINWCAFGVTMATPDNFSEIHQGYVVTHYELTVQLSFYGPDDQGLARRFISGIQLSQNRAAMRAKGLVFKRLGQLVNVPELVAMQWQARVDLQVFLSFCAVHKVPSPSLTQASGSIKAAIHKSEDPPGQSSVIDIPTGCRACARACLSKNNQEF